MEPFRDLEIGKYIEYPMPTFSKILRATYSNEHHWCQTLSAMRFIIMTYYTGSYKDDYITISYTVII